MTMDMHQKGRPSWNKVGGLTLMALVVSIMVGVWMMRQRIFLSPPLAASTPYFYMAVGALPAFATFIIGAWARPIGKRLMWIALPIIAGASFVVYLALIGPGFYNDIQCRAVAGSGSTDRRLECSCRFETIEGKSLTQCTAEKLSPFPFIKLIEEK